MFAQLFLEYMDRRFRSQCPSILCPCVFFQVKLAAGTSQVVRILIFYWQVLFVVPNVLISHLRDLNEAEASQTRKAKNYKDVKKVLTAQKNKSLSVSRCTELPSPVVGKVSKVSML